MARTPSGSSKDDRTTAGVTDQTVSELPDGPADATGLTDIPGVWIAGNVTDLAGGLVSAAAGGSSRTSSRSSRRWSKAKRRARPGKARSRNARPKNARQVLRVGAPLGRARPLAARARLGGQRSEGK